MYNDPAIVIIIILAVLAGGLVKGTIGFGKPMVALPLIAFIIPATTAMILLCAPILLTNFLQMKIKEGVTRFPLCSMVYYVQVEDLRGGKLHIEDDVITAKTNRLVIFSPGKYHCVEPFLGKRTTYCLNPWSVKL